MRIFSDLDELVSAKGEHLGHSDWLELTPRRVCNFAAASSGGPARLAAVEEGAGAWGGSAAGGDIGGPLLLGLLPAMMREIFMVERCGTALNFGLERARFGPPVPVGSRVRGEGELSGAYGVPGGWLVSVRMTVELEGGRLPPACEADTVSLFLV
ncbi:dehydratase [Streptomyces diacarni]|uniref:Dehydratase n=1 Tax=Streptomyces diacarni TaxID=2800381 RepID=A0A367EUN3_9ACTN|nr:dehydratase [Streptomyces diacarni]RCG21315.1 dehydratase [Streptomyces diacarni]